MTLPFLFPLSSRMTPTASGGRPLLVMDMPSTVSHLPGNRPSVSRSSLPLGPQIQHQPLRDGASFAESSLLLTSSGSDAGVPTSDLTTCSTGLLPTQGCVCSYHGLLALEWGSASQNLPPTWQAAEPGASGFAQIPLTPHFLIHLGLAWNRYSQTGKQPGGGVMGPPCPDLTSPLVFCMQGSQGQPRRGLFPIHTA